MTGPCSGTGVGVAKPGFAATQFIGPGAIGGALAALAGWEGAAVGAAIGALTFELATFCPSGPPTPPTFTAADISALLAPWDIIPYGTAAAKMRDFLGGVFWPLLCDCSGGASVVAAPSTYPTGGLSATTPVVTAVPGCFDFLYTSTSATSGSTNRGGPNLPPGLVPTAFVYHCVGTPGTGTTAGIFSWTFEQVDASNTTLSSATVGVATPNGVVDKTVSASPGVASIRLTQTLATGNYTQAIVGSTITAFCNGVLPGATVQPCCPPDPATQAQLDAILSMVTLIQRQAVPFGYIASTAHSGLTGAGGFDIPALVGVKVNVTTIPSSLGSEGTSPAEYFDLGWITFGTADGFPHSIRIIHATQLELPPRCSAFTHLDYDLHPGVVVTITELEREP